MKSNANTRYVNIVNIFFVNIVANPSHTWIKHGFEFIKCYFIFEWYI
jgi:hypothetical protein